MHSFVRFGAFVVAAAVPAAVSARLPETAATEIGRRETSAISNIVRTSDAIYYVQRLGAGGDARLMVRPDGAPPRVVLDLARASKELGPAARWSIANVVPSPDGGHVAVGLMPDGARAQTHTRFVTTATGTLLADDLPRSPSGVSAWSLDGTTAFVSQVPAIVAGDGAGRPSQAIVYRHQLGSTGPDMPAFGIGVDPNVRVGPADDPQLVIPSGSTYAVGVVAHHDRSELTLYSAPVAAVLAGGQIPWRKFADVDDAVTAFAVHGSTIYLCTHDATGRDAVTALDLSDDNGVAANATAVVPVGPVGIDQLAVAKDALYLRGRDGGRAAIRKVAWTDDGSPRATVAVSLPSGVTVSEFATDPDVDGAIVELTSPADPPQVDAIDAGGALHPSGIVVPLAREAGKDRGPD